MQSNSGYNPYANTPAMVPVGAYSAPPSQQYGASQYEKSVANAPPQYASVAMVEATAYPASAYPASYDAPAQTAYTQQYSYGNQPASSPAYSAAPAYNNAYSQVPYVAPLNPYFTASGQVANPAPVAATAMVSSPAVAGPNQATIEFVDKLCWFGIALGAVMMIIGIILLATAPPRECPSGCERQKCYVYDDDQHLDDSGPKDYPCQCSDGGTGSDHCRNPAYDVGSQGYYQLLFGVLNMVFGGLGFFGGWIMMALMRWSEQVRARREYYTSRGLPQPPVHWTSY